MNEPQLSYWDTMIDLISIDRTYPRTSREKIAAGVAVAWDDDKKSLTVAHYAPEWCNQRWAKTFTNLVQGLCPGASVRFTEVRDEQPF